MANSQDWLYKLIKRLPKYHGLAGEDPYRHLKEFQVVCLMFKPSEVPEDWVKWKAFPFSLQDAAKDWLYYKTYSAPYTSWADMQRSFLEKFFRVSTTVSKQREISSIMQLQGETLREYWDRFNQLCASCPNHQISDHLLILHFIDGLSIHDRHYVDAAVGGSLMDKTISEARCLISKLSGCHDEASESELCADFDIILVDNSLTVGADSAADLVEIGEVIFEEPIQVNSKLELPNGLGEVQNNFDNFMHVESEKPLPNSLVVIPGYSEIVDEIFVVEHIDIPDVVYDVCIELDHCFDDNIMPCTDSIDSAVVGKDILNESTQVCSNLEIPVALFEFPLQYRSFDCMCIDPIEHVDDTVELIDSKAFKAAFEIGHLHTPAECIDVMCPAFDALLFIENDSEFTVNKAAMFDDPLMHVDFEFSECSAELNEKDDAYTEGMKEVLVELAGKEELWLLQKCAWKMQNQLPALKRELMQLLQQMLEEDNFNAAMETLLFIVACRFSFFFFQLCSCICCVLLSSAFLLLLYTLS
ncbi:uncharacterized protein LOC111241876 [Vigna radiata var. radiata]|uniref:Uncharacterized protein LOC111241876 n=1 Tax=Vigna radiata var. radiata TaxID=3916 RepID=A0A3Q0F5Z7_VIGRR|nr:uncharacterized protein LOC111241876 [Vigna radiata var. radiata]